MFGRGRLDGDLMEVDGDLMSIERWRDEHVEKMSTASFEFLSGSHRRPSALQCFGIDK